MPQKTWVVGEEVLAADFNTYVQNQVVATFATVAARDASSPPANGALCVTVDTNTVWQRAAGAWVPMVGGEVGYAESTTDYTVVATTQAGANQIPNTNPGNITYPGGVAVTVDFFVVAADVPANCQVIINLWDSATDMGFWGQVIATTSVGVFMPMRLSARLVPSAGVHNYHPRAWKTGAGTVVLRASAGYRPMFCKVNRA